MKSIYGADFGVHSGPPAGGRVGSGNMNGLSLSMNEVSASWPLIRNIAYDEEQLSSDRFMRVHRSIIVNLSNIQVVKRNRIVFDGKVYIAVSEQYKELFQKYNEGNFV
jgi:hypothetical protein